MTSLFKVNAVATRKARIWETKVHKLDVLTCPIQNLRLQAAFGGQQRHSGFADVGGEKFLLGCMRQF